MNAKWVITGLPLLMLGASARQAAATLPTLPDAEEPTLVYSLRLAGVEQADLTDLPAGDYTLEVYGAVVGNEISEGVHGGILQYVFDISLLGDGAKLAYSVSRGFGSEGQPEAWVSSTADPEVFSTNFRAAIDAKGNGVAEIGAMSPSDYDANFDAAGANDWTLFSSGPIEYNGNRSIIEITGDYLEFHLIYGQDGAGGLGATLPSNVLGGTLVLGGPQIPEPSGALLAAMAGLGAGFHRAVR